MKYKNAQDILPDRLLKELQQYVSGETLYIPRRQSRKSWGETSGAREYYKKRNEEIRLSLLRTAVSFIHRLYGLQLCSAQKADIDDTMSAKFSPFFRIFPYVAIDNTGPGPATFQHIIYRCQQIGRASCRERV